MKVQKNNVVELTYELIVDGKLADKATQERPLGYIHGTHMLLPKLRARSRARSRATSSRSPSLRRKATAHSTPAVSSSCLRPLLRSTGKFARIFSS